jgi:hypothetical protein
VTADQDNVPEPQPPTEPRDEPAGEADRLGAGEDDEATDAAHEHARRNRWLLPLIFIIILLVILLAKYGFDTFFKGLGILVS